MIRMSSLSGMIVIILSLGGVSLAIAGTGKEEDGTRSMSREDLMTGLPTPT